MKLTHSLRSFLLGSLFFTVTPLLHATPYYWDTDDITGGFGNTAGTWGTNTFWSMDPTGASATANTTITSTDGVNFGTSTLALTSPATTIGIEAAGVTTNSITFGSAQSTAVTLSGGGTITLAGTTPTITVNNASDTIAANLLGSAGMIKAGTGTLNLTGTNTYTGTTTISAGTLALSGGTNRLLSTGTVALTGTSTLDIGSTSQTLSAVTVQDTPGFANIITGSGGTLTINGASDLQWGPKIVGTNTAASSVNLSGLSNFAYDASANTFRVGLKSGTTTSNTVPGTTTVTLAVSNTITAANLDISLDAGFDSGSSVLRLGAANTLNVGNINVGYGQRSNATLNFAAGSSAVTIRNTNGTSAVTSWNIGSVNSTNNLTYTDAVDFSNGTVDALVETMNIGTISLAGSAATRRGNVAASFTMAGGTMTVANMYIGQFTASAPNVGTMVANGTFTLNSATGTVNATNLILATDTTTGAGTKTVNGTFNLTNGTLNATNVTKGVDTGNATANKAFNWTNGTIGNRTGTDLTWTGIAITLSSGTHTFDISGSNTATLDSASIISGASGITKTGTGTLTLAAANSYTGVTTIDNGTLNAATIANINTNSGIGKGSVSGSAADLVINGGTLQYTGTAAASTNRLFTIGTNGATLDSSGTTLGTLSFTSTGSILFSSSAAPASLTLTGTGTGATGTGSLASIIGNSGSGANITSLTKSGSGSWTLSATNTYTGATAVNAGTLKAGAAAGGKAFGTGSAVTLANVSGATLDLNSFNQTIGSLAGGGVTGGNVTLGLDATLTAGGDNTSTTYAGAISGTGTSGLTKTGSGTLTLTGTNTYSGATTVSAGTLLVNGALGSGDVTVSGGAIGGTGTIGGGLNLTSGSFEVADLFNSLTVSGTVNLYAAFGVVNLTGLTWSGVADGEYTLITGALGTGVFAALSNNTLASAYDLGDGRSAYFKEGSLQLVVIPEPGAALIGSLGMLALLRRRRN